MKESRGKRRLANLLFFCLVALTIGGFWNEDAWDLAKFFTPYIFATGVALYGVDEHYRTARMRPTLSVYQPPVSNVGGTYSQYQRAGGQDQYTDHRDYGSTEYPYRGPTGGSDSTGQQPDYQRFATNADSSVDGNSRNVG